MSVVIQEKTPVALQALTGERLAINPGCSRCGLCQTSDAQNGYRTVRRVCVGGAGPQTAAVMFIGEALGSEEVLQGVPFVGAAGRVFTDCLIEAGIAREQVYVTNVVKCRPPQNRVPRSKEITACLPYLLKEIEDLKPTVIVLVGSTAMTAFLGPVGITRVHGQVFTVDGFHAKFIPVFHPSYVLRRADDSTVRKKFINDLILVRRFAATGSIEKPRQSNHYVLVQDRAAFDGLMCRLFQAEVVDFDCETTGSDSAKDRLICIAFSTRDHEAHVVPLYVEGRPFWGDQEVHVLAELKRFFESEVPKCAHAGALIDIPFLRAVGIDICHYDFDGLVMDYLLDENKPEHQRSLKELAWDYTDMGGYEIGVEEWKRTLGLTREAMDFSRIPFEVLWPYSAADADVLGRCRRAMVSKLNDQHLLPLFQKIVMPLVMVLCDMEATGICVDVARLKQIRREHEEILVDIDQQLTNHPTTLEAKRVLGLETINYDSPVQLRKILFDILKLKPVAQTRKTRQPSTAEASLTVLSRLHELPRLVLQKRAYERLSSYYGKDFETRIRADGRVRTHYLIHGTETGRLSSRNPNLQNIPRSGHETDTGPAAVISRVRDIFVAEPGSLLIDADYAQIEFRLLANYTQDPQMLSDIIHHVDIHKENAALVFGKSPSVVTEQDRQMAKGLTYALIYGATAFRIASLFGISLEAAQGIIDRLYRKYPGARGYHQRMIHSARAQGYVTNLYGRRRRLPGILSTDPRLRGHYERSAINSPIQGLAAELLYIAMIRLHEAFKRECPGARLVLTVHDSITTEVPNSQAYKAIRVIKREMLRSMPGITVPLEVELKTGTSLGNMTLLALDESPGILVSGNSKRHIHEQEDRQHG